MNQAYKWYFLRVEPQYYQMILKDQLSGNSGFYFPEMFHKPSFKDAFGLSNILYTSAFLFSG